jgi:uncharacterized integral membrane protein
MQPEQFFDPSTGQKHPGTTAFLTDLFNLPVVLAFTLFLILGFLIPTFITIPPFKNL